MKSFRIYVDLTLPTEALDLLISKTAHHRLIFPSKPLSSVLAKADRDPQFSPVDIAFGQPDLPSIQDTRSLRWIHVSSAGITRYDTSEFRALARERGFAVTNSSLVYQEACAVHALSFILAQARRLPLALKTSTPNGSPTWQMLRSTSRTLRGETVFIVGFGAIGRRLVELLEPLGVKIEAYRRIIRGDEGVPVVTESDFSGALRRADHVVNILPESDRTRRFFDRARFSAMKPGSAFYNIGRGATVDQEALLQALRSGLLVAAWLDVTDPEPLPEDHPLLSEPNCFVTPHIAGGHTGETTALVRHFLGNLQRFEHGEALIDRVI